MANNQTFTLNIKALFDASDVKAKVGDIQSTLSKLKLPDKLATDLNNSFTNVNKALDDFISKTEKGVKTKADATGITKSFDAVTKELTNLDNLMIKVKSQIGDGVDLSKIIKIDDKTRNELTQLEEKIKAIQTELANINTNKLSQLESLLAKIKSGSGASKQGQAALELFKQGDVEGAIQSLNKIIKKLEEYKKAHTDAKTGATDKDLTNVSNSLEQLTKMRTEMISAQTESAGKINEINNLSAEAAQKLATAQSSVVTEVNNASTALGNYKTQATSASSAINNLTTNQAQFVKEVDQVKSRVQYFFGLANSINLVKRAIRGAVDTVKELDKAMTETAVVTDHTVSDMWAKLPEYTKRANELGVSTLAAYQSATLYYQQGLNDEQAAALSTETLKMARIAGLEAADATDRMTNALRGFNMELNSTDAQRVDDVYSQLAAMSASNVDEISTAMTKVASLAHSANMEFETTAAFLAQIIETTRESAETAGTALKTVVARFSEVKKLYDMDELKGKDEEGQTVDVNKVSSALRTAGIDLNKYFLGEVGLDDIFMELASKWDSLTSVQQRYIATQAAGSRQQSRFIALMQDYARTQQLVSAAYNANGASAKQFEKTQESLQSKLARLKNAWDAFLMGLANNAIIKGAVDLLTLLLNTVNNLTSAFGTGIGTILKWVAAISGFVGLKSAFGAGGIATKAIGGLVGNTPIGNAIKFALGTVIKDEKGNFVPAENEARQPILFGDGGLLSKAGKGLWGGLGKFGAKAAFNTGIGGSLFDAFSASSSSAIASNAAALTGVVTALGAVAAAVGVVIAAYTAWLELTPEGQLKQANQIADAMNKVASNVQKTASSYKNVQKSYQEYSDAVNSSTSVSGRKTAIQNRNDYITQLLESDPAYAEYISSMTDESGQFILTLDESALAAAVDKISDSAVKTAIASQMAQANVNTKQAQVYAERAANTQYRLNMAKSMGLDTKQLESELVQYQNQIVSLNQAAQNQIGASARQMLANSNLDSELANKLAEIYSNVYDNNAYQKAFDKYNLNAFSRLFDQGTRKQEYESIFGIGSAKGLDRKEIADALAGYRIENEQQSNLNAVAQLLESGDYDQILDAIVGNIDFSEDDINNANEKLQSFADALGVNITEIEQQIKQNQKARQEIRKTNQANIFDFALRTGNRTINNDFQQQIQNLKPETTNLISSILDQAENALSQSGLNTLFDNTFNLSDDELKQLQGFFNNFSLDNPIQALHQFNEAKKQALTLPNDSNIKNAFDNILTDIEKTNTSLFDTGNLVQSFLASSSYDSLTDSLEKFIKENGRITSDNIDELASSCQDLQYLLEETDITAQGLAETLTLLETGALSFDMITSSLLAALSAGESFEGLIDKVGKWIKDFNEGTDLTQGTEHIVDVAKKASEYVKNWQFGNEPLENIYDHLFGEGAYNEYMSNNYTQKSFEEIEKDLSSQIEKISKWAENEGLGALQFLANGKLPGLTTTDGLNFDWNLEEFNSTAEAISAVADALGVTDDAARAFIESWGSHMWDLRQEWDELDFNEKFTAFSNDIKKTGIVTEKELDAFAKSVGKTAEEIKGHWQTIFGNVDLNNRPKIEWNEDNYNKNKAALDSYGFSYDDLAGNYSTLLSSAASYGENGEYVITFTPIIEQNGEAIIKSQEEVDNYINNIIQQLEEKGKEINLDNILELDSGKNGLGIIAGLSNTIEEANELGTRMHEISADIESGATFPVIVNWQDEDGNDLSGGALFDKFKEQFSSGTANGGFTSVLTGTIKSIVDGSTSVDWDLLNQKLINEFKLSPSQAADVADDIISEIDGNFTKEIKIPVITEIKDEDGKTIGHEITFETKVIEADTGEELQKKVELETDAADYAVISEKLAEVPVDQLGSNISTTMETGGNAGCAAIASAIESYPWPKVTIDVEYNEINKPLYGLNMAHGGLVKSYAKGSENFHVGAGTALTGEEGPELVWNKNGGYAYVTGQDGPEFANLHPGDRIFNASETKRIFANSRANGGLVDSFASGGWKDPAASSKSGGGKSSGSGSSGKDKTPEEWKNDLDWLYNLMEDIAELERDQKAIEEQYEDLLQDQTKTGGDLYRLLVKQLGNLYTQLNHQTFALEKREQEMREFMDITNDQDQYLWYNWQDRTLEIDWDAIDQITDEEQYKHVKELIDEAEEIQDKIDDADDSIMDITNQIQELENIWRDTFIDFEDRVLDAIIKSYQQIIDNYSELNDTLNNSNTQILDSLQKQISLERQIRDNTKTEEEISDEEARLAYLRRDTSGGNELAALQLEKELADQRESYEDTLVDQAISRLQEDNDAAAQQRERQIEIMQAQLDYQSENGEFNAYISELLTTAMGADGELLTNSDLVTLLKEQENWDAMSAVSKQVWDEELNGTFKEVAAFLLKENAEQNGTFYTALTEAVKSVSTQIGSYSQAMVKLGNSISSMGSSGGYSGGGSGGSSGRDPDGKKPPQSKGSGITAGQAGWNDTARMISSLQKAGKLSGKYATGGLADSTGLAWLDGTAQEPEYVLNARQTDAFLKLADVLPSMMNGISTNMSNTFGSTYLNVSVNLESVSPDYDVDRMVDLIKDRLYDTGSYRNVNSLSFLR